MVGPSLHFSIRVYDTNGSRHQVCVCACVGGLEVVQKSTIFWVLASGISRQIGSQPSQPLWLSSSFFSFSLIPSLLFVPERSVRCVITEDAPRVICLVHLSICRPLWSRRATLWKSQIFSGLSNLVSGRTTDGAAMSSHVTALVKLPNAGDCACAKGTAFEKSQKM